jgi:hypothetical protein
MFVDPYEIDEAGYICLLSILNVARTEGYSIPAKALIENMRKVVPSWAYSIETINILNDKGLAYFTDKDGDSSRELATDGYVGLSFLGIAFLINYAEAYLETINKKFGDVPENLVATLIPYLNLTTAPAADRFVSTKDNLPEFKKLELELQTIRLEIVKDENSNALPIPDKKAVLADIDAVLAQIKEGYVRISDLTSRIRPVVRNLAEWCKDITIIAGAAGAAYIAIEHILQKVL